MRTRSEESKDSILLHSKEHPNKDYIGYSMAICDQSSRNMFERSGADVG